ncbi:MAG: hypothetical protein UY23_C0001G0153 [Candidatus Jorgensenbacteria bacterium GW2011_GWA1_48_11]|uniref:O-antigen ligase-related domain-containing protein n=1 Tax=Candidatus Jorgensenbacteria bacterium GW2011_GWA1_48_11 TaxID=1618660 RepID=A0A0G1UBP7_9BACT|nr:MAG: hypothetical protein UY23_C0001G0153 [Candidatus Jorgensenbacteria bacterium GW2011_GWA1_48_11]KKW12040.1 MAG: hypothetical protein UY51_C0005G0282 [Candidatus Jorgensenbacteria bacterium GW2011_GWB1_49_9]
MKQIFKGNKQIRFFFFLFLIWLPFGTKKFIYPFIAGSVSELNSAFLYASELFLAYFLFLTFLEWRRTRTRLDDKPNFILLSLFLAAALVSVFFAFNKSLALYQLVHLILGMGLALVLGYLLKTGVLKNHEIFSALGLGALFQSFVAFWQFKFQHSLGLYFLGESLASPFVKGVSEISVAGGRLMRAYGTMSHANILAAFLVLGLISFYYFYLEAKNFGARILSAVGIFFIGLALIFTFSRSGWITAILASLIFLVWAALNRDYRRRISGLAVILGACFLLFLITMGWAIFPRARLAIDSSINDRLIYNRMAVQIVGQHPLGVGIGNEMLFGIETKLFQNYGLDTVNRWQPIHNLYLLMAAEIGVLASLIFIFFLVRIFVRCLGNSRNNPRIITAGTLLLALLIGGFSDHFLWDLQSGRLMLWLVIGILLGIGRSPRGLMDKTSPSEGGNRGSIPLEGTR